MNCAIRKLGGTDPWQSPARGHAFIRGHTEPILELDAFEWVITLSVRHEPHDQGELHGKEASNSQVVSSEVRG